MRKVALTTVGLAAGVTLVGASASQAATTTADLSMAGNVVAGVQSAQQGHEIPLLFTLKNNSTTTSASVDFKFTITNGAASSATDYVCPLISNHFSINPD